MDQLKSIIRGVVSRPPSIPGSSLFDELVSRILEYHDAPCHSLAEMRARKNTKVKGDIFESFCKLYLLRIRKFDDVWLLSEVPDDVAQHLGIGKRDVGIDIVARLGEEFSAVQCKFKMPRSGTVPGTWIPYNCVNWKELSTFYALCGRTNENRWKHHIVMTNTKYVRHMGDKTRKDLSICNGTFQKLTSLDMLDMIKEEKRNLNTEPQPSVEDVRAARLKYFQPTESATI